MCSSWVSLKFVFQDFFNMYIYTYIYIYIYISVVCMCEHLYIRIIDMWILVVCVHCICMYVWTWLYVLCRIHLFTRILFMWFAESLCKHFYEFQFWIWEWYVCILRKRRHGRYRPLNIGSQVWNYRVTSLGAGPLSRFIIGIYNLQGRIANKGFNL